MRAASLSYPAVSEPAASYDYRYEFSETRKVLEEFFKAENEFPASAEPEPRPDLDYSLTRLTSSAALQAQHPGSSYVGQRLAVADDELAVVPLSSPHYSRELLDLVSVPSLPQPRLSQVIEVGDLPPPPPAPYHDSRNFTLSPETTDCDSADLESELSVPSVGEGSYHSSGPRHTTMPILEVRRRTYYFYCSSPLCL